LVMNDAQGKRQPFAMDMGKWAMGRKRDGRLRRNRNQNWK
jgi:hypothetical protein